MNLLRFRPTTRTERLLLPDGSTRRVKVTTSDAFDYQQVEDGDHLHAHTRPAAVAVFVRKGREPKVKRLFAHGETGLWAPVPIDPDRPDVGVAHV